MTDEYKAKLYNEKVQNCNEFVKLKGTPNNTSIEASLSFVQSSETERKQPKNAHSRNYRTRTKLPSERKRADAKPHRYLRQIKIDLTSSSPAIFHIPAENNTRAKSAPKTRKNTSDPRGWVSARAKWSRRRRLL